MAFKLDIKVTSKGQIAKGTAPGKFLRAIADALNEGGLYIEQEVAKGTPVNRGHLRGSISHSVKGAGTSWAYGRVFSPLEYAKPVEEGQTPHWPPLNPIVRWAKRKLKLKKKQRYIVATKIALKIFQVGTLPVHMFKKVAKASKTARVLRRIFEKHTKKFVSKMKPKS